MAVGATEAGIAIKLFELAKRQGWLDRLASSFKKRHRILVLGCTGTGKSQFVESLTESLPAAIDRLNRTEFAQKHSIKIAKTPFEFIDTPGQRVHRERRLAAVREAVTKPVAGIINVVAYGFHEGSTGKDQAIGGGRPHPEFLAARREDEIAALREWIPIVGSRDTAGWLITVVTKADLWWPDRDSVLAHYAAGEYATALEPAKELRPVVMEYCSVFKKYFGEAPMAGTFDESDRTRARGHLLKQLLAAVGKDRS